MDLIHLNLNTLDDVALQAFQQLWGFLFVFLALEMSQDPSHLEQKQPLDPYLELCLFVKSLVAWQLD